MLKLNGVRVMLASVSATNMVPLMAGSPANVEVLGWNVLPELGPVMVRGEYVRFS